MKGLFLKMNKERKDTRIRRVYHSYEELPLALTAEDIAAVLNISRGLAFTLLHDPSFPTLHVGKRLLVPKDLFFKWMKAHISEGAHISLDDWGEKK